MPGSEIACWSVDLGSGNYVAMPVEEADTGDEGRAAVEIWGKAPSDLTLDRNFLQIGEIPARARGEIYSATQFLLYTQCRTRYYLRYRLGIPETISEVFGLIV